MSTARIAFIATITLACGLLGRRYLAEPVYIASASMEPTLTVGHHLFVDKITYRFRKPGRQEIICFESPVGEAHDSIKRVIAVEGDTVGLKEKKVYLNGEPQLEIYTRYTRAGETLEGDNLGPLKVPPDSFFVLGDNRDNSNDSATWKDPATGERFYFIKLERVRGKVRGIY
ncbi:MAG TPA: signal peptidase I [Elusimicrobia bacterium]|nr:signal peptidase I [Elusimicrobiota bacterium]